MSLAITAVCASSASAATITPDTVADDTTVNGNCTLREAVIAANTDTAVDACAAGSGADTITVPAGTYVLTLEEEDDAAATGDLDLTEAVDIVGAGVDATIIDGNGQHRVFDVAPRSTDVSVTISGVTIANGAAGQGGCVRNGGDLMLIMSTVRNCYASSGFGVAAAGGGISSEADGSHITLINSTVRDNSVFGFFGPAFGGGISAQDLTLVGSTVSDNTASGGYGGGIAVSNGRIANSTITRNDGGTGGGIAVSGGTLRLTSSTVSHNQEGGLTSYRAGAAIVMRNTIVANNFGANCVVTIDAGPTTFTADAYNLGSDDSCGFSRTDVIADDPRLGPLDDNGGPTFTRLVRPGSPAINAANPAAVGGEDTACERTDQRGVVRPQGERCDIGAFEATAVCGDGRVDPGEECDDSNPAAGDGCHVCTIEACYVCSGAPSSCELDNDPPCDGGVTITVDTMRDSTGAGGRCALRDAIVAANDDRAVAGCPAGNGADTIILPPGVYRLTDIGENEDGARTGDLDICDHLEIRGRSGGSTIIDGNQSDRVFDVDPEATGVRVTLGGLTITNGDNVTEGGGIRNRSNLTLNDIVISGNRASGLGGGGGVRNQGTLVANRSMISENHAGGGGGISTSGGSNTLITDSSVRDNTAGGNGGGILSNGDLTLRRSVVSGNDIGGGVPRPGPFSAGGIVATNQTHTTIENSTITGNFAIAFMISGGTLVAKNSTIANNGIGIYRLEFIPVNTTVVLQNTIIANNVGDCALSHPRVTIVAEAYNLDSDDSCGLSGTDLRGVDPRLARAAGDNGGPTFTLTLLPGSPAIDAGSPAAPGSGDGACERTDQRGAARPFGARCDIGAFEFGAEAPPTPTPQLISDCAGDCNGDLQVLINELVMGVNIALERMSLDVCASFDVEGDGVLDIADLASAINHSLNGCS